MRYMHRQCLDHIVFAINGREFGGQFQTLVIDPIIFSTGIIHVDMVGDAYSKYSQLSQLSSVSLLLEPWPLLHLVEPSECCPSTTHASCKNNTTS